LGKIAKQLYGSESQFPLIVAANRISNPDRLQVGQRLNIPDSGTATPAFVVTPPEPPRTYGQALLSLQEHGFDKSSFDRTTGHASRLQGGILGRTSLVYLPSGAGVIQQHCNS
jgi:hypothetical protein